MTIEKNILITCTGAFACYQTYRLQRIKQVVIHDHQSFNASSWSLSIETCAQHLEVEYVFYDEAGHPTRIQHVPFHNTQPMSLSSKKFYITDDERFIADSKLGIIREQVSKI